MKRTFLLVFASVFVASFAACGASDIVVGDDSALLPDGATSDSTTQVSDVDAQEVDANVNDASVDAVGDAKDDVDCPALVPPPAGACDGGPLTPIYCSNGCACGWGCGKIPCTTGGGTCVALAPGTCPSGHVGDATKYSCGAGVGVMCCLP